MKKILLSTSIIAICNIGNAQTPCVDGMAGNYPCEDIDLLSVMDLDDLGGAQNGNDVWGWVSGGREFAIMGKDNGTAFIEITDPLNPVLVGTLATHSTPSLWRDIKVYQDHAFIVSEAPSHGMQVFDLSQLVTATDLPVEFEETAHYDGFGNAHNIAINESSGFAYAVGTSTFNGGLHIIDITNPTNPVIAGEFAEDGYSHDAQIINYAGPDADYIGAEIAVGFNEDNVAIINVTDKSDCQLISSVSYDLVGYTHQGWFTEDHRFLLVDDELDESNYDINTRTYIYDVQDLDNPVEIGYYESSIAAADHNQYVLGNLAFQSNYMGGLRVLDLSNIAAGTIEEVAYFDTNPESNESFFWGTWSNYPYFPSGNVVISTFSNFFVVHPNITLDAEELPNVLEVNVAPNPTNGIVAVSWNGRSPGHLEVFDIAGKLVIQTPEFRASEGKITIDMESLVPGIYFLRSSNGITSDRIIKF